MKPHVKVAETGFKPRSLCRFETHQGHLCPRTTSEPHSLTAWAPSIHAAEQRAASFPALGSHAKWVTPELNRQPHPVKGSFFLHVGSAHTAQTLLCASVSKDGDIVARQLAAASLGYLANQERTEQADTLGLSIPSCPPGLISASSLQSTQGYVGRHEAHPQKALRTQRLT